MAIENVERTDHLCWLYSGRDEWRHLACRLLRAATARGSRAIYHADGEAEDLREDLEHLRDRDELVDAGRLLIVPRAGKHARDPEADDSDGRRYAELEALIRAAMDDGRHSVTVVAEATSLATGDGLGYQVCTEFRVDVLSRSVPLVMHCGYDRDRLTSCTAAALSFVHPYSSVYLGPAASCGMYAGADGRWDLHGDLSADVQPVFGTALRNLPVEGDVHLDFSRVTAVAPECVAELQAHAAREPARYVVVHGAPHDVGVALQPARGLVVLD